jgi:hypothetical protein
MITLILVIMIMGIHITAITDILIMIMVAIMGLANTTVSLAKVLSGAANIKGPVKAMSPVTDSTTVTKSKIGMGTSKRIQEFSGE